MLVVKDEHLFVYLSSVCYVIIPVTIKDCFAPFDYVASVNQQSLPAPTLTPPEILLRSCYLAILVVVFARRDDGFLVLITLVVIFEADFFSIANSIAISASSSVGMLSSLCIALVTPSVT